MHSLADINLSHLSRDRQIDVYVLEANRRFYLMEAEVILDGVRAEEDDSLSCHHQDEAVQGLQRENILFVSCF